MVIKVMLGNGTNDCFRVNTHVEDIIFYPEKGQFVQIMPIVNEWAMHRIEFKHLGTLYRVQWRPSWDFLPASAKVFRVILEDVYSLVESD